MAFKIGSSNVSYEYINILYQCYSICCFALISTDYEISFRFWAYIIYKQECSVTHLSALLLNRTILLFSLNDIYTKMCMYILLEKARKKYEKMNSGFLSSNLKFYIYIQSALSNSSSFYSYYLLYYHQVCSLLILLLNINRLNDHTIPYIF